MNRERIPTYKALYKPMLWGQLPRGIFIGFIIFTLTFLVTFKNVAVVIATACVYALLVALIKYDAKILSIIIENFKFKDVYFPD